MNFLFVDSEEIDKLSLRQGDLLVRNSALKTILEQAHSYYANAEDYTHFVVLTQSCDLVRRNGKAKTRYISLAAARPLDVVIKRFVDKHRFDLPFPISVCNKEMELSARQMLERLLHNTEDGYFFIKSDSHPSLTRDLCVFLPLSVAVRVDHYDGVLSTKIAQLEDIFAAKLGWMVGNIYSRIGTPDLEEKVPDAKEYKNTFFEDALFRHTAWLSSTQFRELKQRLTTWKRDNPTAELSEDNARQLLEGLPTSHDVVVARVLSLLENNAIIKKNSVEMGKAKNLLLGDPNLKKLTQSF